MRFVAHRNFEPDPRIELRVQNPGAQDMSMTNCVRSIAAAAWAVSAMAAHADMSTDLAA